MTYARQPGLDADDEPLANALKERGLAVTAVPWDSPEFDWAGVQAALLRSPWDYYLRRDDFLAWVEATAAKTRLFNPAPVVRWNTHKGYLLELAQKGAPVVPTFLLEAGDSLDLAELLAERGWEQAIVKPAVSADSWETIHVTRRSATLGQSHVDRLAPSHDLLIQPFLSSVETHGERCLVFLDGVLSHAVRKRSLTQGGRHSGPEGVEAEIAPEEAAAAQQALTAAGFSDLLYARVDLARDEEGQPRLLELELTEPTLFLRQAPPEAAQHLADALLRRL